MKLTTILSATAASAVPVMALESSTYVFAQNDAKITVSLTAAADTKDLFFHISAPSAYDWVSVGIGASMTGALTLIAYPAKNGKSMTLSPRLSTGRSEPTYNKDINCKIVGDSNPYANEQVDLSIICRDAAHWSNPPLDLTSTKAPFIWAIGRPTYKNGSSWSDSPSADLRSHSAFAKFTMDMAQATVSSNPDSIIPDLGNATSGAASFANVSTKRDYLSPGHAIASLVALLVLIPLDSVLRLFIKTVKFHIFMYILISIIFFLGSGLGFAVSGQFNRTKKYNSAHQVVGIIIFIFFILQVPLGFFAHRRDKAGRQARQVASEDTDPLTTTPVPPRKRNPLSLAHIILGGAILILAIINGGLGFNLALTSTYNMRYAIVMVAIFIVWLGISGLRFMWTKRKQDDFEEEEHDRKTKAAIEAYQMQRMHDHNEFQPPPSYGAAGQYPAVSIPRSY